MRYNGRVQCLQCGTILESTYRHDYRVCMCSNSTMVGGGSDYLRCGGMSLDKVRVLQDPEHGPIQEPLEVINGTQATS